MTDYGKSELSLKCLMIPSPSEDLKWMKGLCFSKEGLF
jgi:hypothetical protein